jgi:tripartite-type tricarboxylate transporter receptor subunit TctC
MKISRWKFLSLAAIAVMSFSSSRAWSQSTNIIKLIVPFPAGGGLDILARLLAEQIGRTHGPSIVVENRPGAGTVIGTEAASRAAPDGNTLLFNTPNFVISPHLRKVNYDPLTGFKSICLLADAPQLIVVNTASPYRTLSDLMNAARTKPGDLTLAGGGTAINRISFETLRRTANVSMTFVPYPGTPAVINALLGEHVRSGFSEYPAVMEQLRVGSLRALATLSRTRIDSLPDVPTVAESGYKDYEQEFWYGLFAPAKTPNETVSQIADRFSAALQGPDVKAKLATQGLYPVGMCGEAFGIFVRAQYEQFGRVIREANIKAE